MFSPINLDTWPRGQVFHHFYQDVRCVICLTSDLDVTPVVTRHKQEGLRFYPAMIWLVSTAVNSLSSFRMGKDADGRIGIWDRVDPSYIVFHPEDEQFTRLVTPYHPVFEEFYAAVTSDVERYSHLRGHAFTPVPPNIFDVSCLPWIRYRAFGLHVFDDGRYLAPVITWGRYEQQGDRFLMPLSVQIHHAAADGYHVAQFYERLQQAIDRF